MKRFAFMLAVLASTNTACDPELSLNECRSNADCAFRPGLVCSPENWCVEPEGSTPMKDARVIPGDMAMVTPDMAMVTPDIGPDMSMVTPDVGPDMAMVTPDIGPDMAMVTPDIGPDMAMVTPDIGPDMAMVTPDMAISDPDMRVFDAAIEVDAAP